MLYKHHCEFQINEKIIPMLTFLIDQVLRQLYFFPRVILYSRSFMMVLGLGFCGWGLILGFWGWGYQLMGFGACGVGPSGFFGLGLSI